jgi:hypothetical protein
VYVIMQDGSEFRVSRRKGKAFLDLAKHKNTAYLNNNNLH